MTARRLFLMRHAQAAPGPEDKTRSLTPQGLAEAEAQGRAMRAKGYIPDLILCSPARRTRQTLQQILAGLGEIKTAFPEVAYYATVGQLHGLLRQADDRARQVMLVSHNPTIHGLAAFLTGDGPEEMVQSLALGYREGTLSVLEYDGESWDGLQPGGCRLVDLMAP